MPSICRFPMRTLVAPPTDSQSQSFAHKIKPRHEMFLYENSNFLSALFCQSIMKHNCWYKLLKKLNILITNQIGLFGRMHFEPKIVRVLLNILFKKKICRILLVCCSFKFHRECILADKFQIQGLPLRRGLWGGWGVHQPWR